MYLLWGEPYIQVRNHVVYVTEAKYLALLMIFACTFKCHVHFWRLVYSHMLVLKITQW